MRISPMSERSPLHELTAATGATFVEEAGWLMPGRYREVADECAGTRTGLALFDLSHRGKIELTGKEAALFLHNLATNDIKNLAYSRGCETFLCNAQARVLASALVYHLKIFRDQLLSAGHESFWLDLDPGLLEKVSQHFDRHLISEIVDITDRTREFSHLHLAGPLAPPALAAEGVGALAENELIQDGYAENTMQIRRRDRLGVPGFDIVCPRERAARQWNFWRERGAVPVGLETYDVLRIEAGIPVYGKDIDENNLAPEVGRTAQAISYAKGCYLGQEPIVRVRDLGHVNRVLKGLVIDGQESVPSGAKILRESREVGHVTSSVFSPRAARVLALAYLRRGNTDPDTLVEVGVDNGSRPGTVSTLPFPSSLFPE
jgi:folate-binding protein YgfZ